MICRLALYDMMILRSTSLRARSAAGFVFLIFAAGTLLVSARINSEKKRIPGLTGLKNLLKSGAQHANALVSRIKNGPTDEDKASLAYYVKVTTRAGVDFYKQKLVAEAEDWEFMGYDVRDPRETVEGFEFLSESVKEQQRKAYRGVQFRKICNDRGPPAIHPDASKNPNFKGRGKDVAEFKRELESSCFTNIGKKCVGTEWAVYLESNNDDYTSNMPLFKADPFNQIQGNQIVSEPCNSVSNGAFYMVADVDGIRADKNGNGDEDMQQAAANMAFGSFYYHGMGNSKFWDMSRKSDVLAMDYLFTMMFEKLLHKVCVDVACMNELYTIYLKEGDMHGDGGLFAKTDADLKRFLLNDKEEWGLEGKGFQTKHFTRMFGTESATGVTDFKWGKNSMPLYKTSVVGIVLLWLRTTFSAQIPSEKGNVMFKQVSMAVIEALVTKSADKARAFRIRDVIMGMNMKAVQNVPKAYITFTKMIQKFLGAKYFQEVDAGPSLLHVFGRYDTCPFQPHSTWHRQVARMTQLIVRGITVDLDAASLKDKLTNGDKVGMIARIVSNIPSMGAETLNIVNIARLALETKLHETGFAYQIEVNRGLRVAIDDKLHQSPRPSFGSVSRRRRLLADADLESALVNRASVKVDSEERVAFVLKSKSAIKDSIAKKKKKMKEEEGKTRITSTWNDGKRDVCKTGPQSSTSSIYDNFVEPWMKIERESQLPTMPAPPRRI